MTHFLQDILRQPNELRGVIELLHGEGRKPLATAASTVRTARHVYLTGIGASYNAALGAAWHFHSAGHPVCLLDAAELLHSASIPSDSVLIVLSRSGRSIEIVKSLEKAQAARAKVIGITNFLDGPLAQQADIPIVLPVKPDHGISANTYISLAAGAASIASTLAGTFDTQSVSRLLDAITSTAATIPAWQQQLEKSAWLLPGATYYFLARGASLASSYGAQLLWEEGVKVAAVAMGTDSFRHGPQEIVTAGMRFAIWIDDRLREADLAVARDLRRLGASVMLIGSNLPVDAGDLVIQLPPWPSGWQFLMDIVPAQLAAEALARLTGADCDSFRFASY
ncbi:MAG TPA: SIS domain-containing protein, partial [Edaphobacter sp.]|nr:SIS domain-containing protein [Edaphobacter sp.]